MARTAKDDEARDPIAELERLDRFLEGEEEGARPLEVLRAKGLEIPDEPPGDDEALHKKLWEVIEAMAAIGLYVESTDHMSDRELYRYLVSDALREETFLSDDPASAWHLSPIGGGSEEDNEIYLRYYADDERRADWKKDFGEPIPPKEPLPFDRDRLLPVQSFEPEEETQ